MPGAVELLEYVGQPTSGLTVDAEAGVVRGVRVLGLDSQNGRRYLPEAVRAAVPLYQRRAVNVDHPARANEATGLGRRVGWLENVRQDSDGGLRGDLHLLTAHPLAPMILEAAVRNPALLGLSHNAHGRTRREGGKEVIEAIDRVNSVDLVADPASVAGLHEGRGRRTMKLRELIEHCACNGRPDYAKALREVADAGIMPPDAEMAEPAAPASNGGDHEQAILDAAVAVLKDEGLSTAEKMSKIRKLLGMTGGGGGGGDMSDDMPSEEGRKRPRGNLTEQRLRLENHALRLLAGKGVRLTPLIERAIKGCDTEAEIKELLDGLPADGGGQRPRSATPGPPPPARGGADVTEGKAPTDPKEFTRYATTR